MDNLKEAITLFNKSSDVFRINYFQIKNILHLYIYDLINDKYWHLESEYKGNYKTSILIKYLNELCYKLRGDEFSE